MKSGKLKSTDSNGQLLVLSPFQSFVDRKAFLFQFSKLACCFPSLKLAPPKISVLNCCQTSGSFLDMLELLKRE